MASTPTLEGIHKVEELMGDLLRAIPTAQRSNADALGWGSVLGKLLSILKENGLDQVKSAKMKQLLEKGSCLLKPLLGDDWLRIIDGGTLPTASPKAASPEAVSPKAASPKVAAKLQKHQKQQGRLEKSASPALPAIIIRIPRPEPEENRETLPAAAVREVPATTAGPSTQLFKSAQPLRCRAQIIADQRAIAEELDRLATAKRIIEQEAVALRVLLAQVEGEVGVEDSDWSTNHG